MLLLQRRLGKNRLGKPATCKVDTHVCLHVCASCSLSNVQMTAPTRTEGWGEATRSAGPSPPSPGPLSEGLWPTRSLPGGRSRRNRAQRSRRGCLPRLVSSDRRLPFQKPPSKTSLPISLGRSESCFQTGQRDGMMEMLDL